MRGLFCTERRDEVANDGGICPAGMNLPERRLLEQRMHSVRSNPSTGEHGEAVASTRLQLMESRGPCECGRGSTGGEDEFHSQHLEQVQRGGLVCNAIKRPVKGDFHRAGERHQFGELLGVDRPIVLQRPKHNAIDA